MTQQELQVWFKGCVEYYNTNCEDGLEMCYEYRNYVEYLKKQLSQKKETYVQGVEYVSTIETIQFVTQFKWNERPMNSYLITLDGVEGKFTLTMATIDEQAQPQVGTIIRHYITGTKITTFKFVAI
jgi:hypothetical protein